MVRSLGWHGPKVGGELLTVEADIDAGQGNIIRTASWVT